MKARANPNQPRPPIARELAPIADPYTTPAAVAHTLPDCAICCQIIELLDDATVLVPGQFMLNRDLGQPVLVLDPDHPLEVVQLSNGQLGLIGIQKALVVHDACFQSQMDGAFNFETDGDEL